MLPLYNFDDVLSAGLAMVGIVNAFAVHASVSDVTIISVFIVLNARSRQEVFVAYNYRFDSNNVIFYSDRECFLLSQNKTSC